MNIRRYVCIAFLSIAGMNVSAAAGASQSSGEKTFDVLATKSGTYSNVTVTTKSKNYIFILHSQGMANIRIPDLPIEVQQELGYAKANDEKSENRGVVLAKQLVPDIEKKIQPFEAQIQSGIQAGRQSFDLNPMYLFGALGVFLLIYVFMCYCAHLICIKAGQPASALVWLPGLQMIPLLRAAGMSGWWFLVTIIPVANFILHVVWSLKIASARGKSVLVGILLILPVTNLIAFLYLAFSDAGDAGDDAPRQKTMSLQAA